MNQRKKVKIAALCMTVAAVCLYGSAMLSLANGQAAMAALNLTGTGFWTLEAILQWRRLYRDRE